MKLVTSLAVGVYLFCAPRYANAIGQPHYILDKPVAGAFPIARAQTATRVYVDSADWPGVAHAAGDLQADVRRVTGIHTVLVRHQRAAGACANTVGTIGKSTLIDRWVREKKIDASGVTEQWEAFVTQTVANPLPGIADALVIAGSDKRRSTASTTLRNRLAYRPRISQRTCR